MQQQMTTYLHPLKNNSTLISFQPAPDSHKLQMSFAPYGAIWRVKGSVTAHQRQGPTAAQTTCSCKSKRDCPLCVRAWHPAPKGRWYHYDSLMVPFHTLLNNGDTTRADQHGMDSQAFI